MYSTKITDLIVEVRNRIENISEEDYRIALMYAYITCTDVSQVSGKYRPLGTDAKKITVYNHSSPIDLIMFKIKPNRVTPDIEKGIIIFSLFPASDSFDPWINIIYSYFQKSQDEPPFKFHDNFSNSTRYLQWRAEEVFTGLDVDFLFYSEREMEKKDLDEKRMNLNALRRLRVNDLMINYGFTALDLALFNNRNDRFGPLSHHVRDLRAENLLNYSDEELSHRAIPYLTKFLKKNEDDIQLEILTAIQGYFVVYAYDKLTGNYNTPEEELIEDLSHLIQKDKAIVKNLLDQISGFNSIETERHNQNQSQLEKIHQWYWNNRKEAPEKFIEFFNALDSDATLIFDEDLKNINIENQKFIEEGSLITYSNFQMRKRSPELLKKAREHFKNEDEEGKLRCMVCGYTKPDFVDREIVHIHHMEPLKDIPKEGITTTIEDAIKKTMPLCPTCHSVVHANEGLLIDQIIEYTRH
ncbi:MAG: HNH endonuclease [Candidatus Bathyarchaeota archaeon]|nr:HNH endonuclease [Candidatus Bathyarchaeota archaeon]